MRMKNWLPALLYILAVSVQAAAQETPQPVFELSPGEMLLGVEVFAGFDLAGGDPYVLRTQKPDGKYFRIGGKAFGPFLELGNAGPARDLYYQSSDSSSALRSLFQARDSSGWLLYFSDGTRQGPYPDGSNLLVYLGMDRGNWARFRAPGKLTVVIGSNRYGPYEDAKPLFEGMIRSSDTAALQGFEYSVSNSRFLNLNGQLLGPFGDFRSSDFNQACFVLRYFVQGDESKVMVISNALVSGPFPSGKLSEARRNMPADSPVRIFSYGEEGMDSDTEWLNMAERSGGRYRVVASEGGLAVAAGGKTYGPYPNLEFHVPGGDWGGAALVGTGKDGRRTLVYCGMSYHDLGFVSPGKYWKTGSDIKWSLRAGREGGNFWQFIDGDVYGPFESVGILFALDRGRRWAFEYRKDGKDFVRLGNLVLTNARALSASEMSHHWASFSWLSNAGAAFFRGATNFAER